MANVGSFSHFVLVFVFVFAFVFLIVITGASVDSTCHELSEYVWLYGSRKPRTDRCIPRGPRRPKNKSFRKNGIFWKKIPTKWVGSRNVGIFPLFSRFFF